MKASVAARRRESSEDDDDGGGWRGEGGGGSGFSGRGSISSETIAHSRTASGGPTYALQLAEKQRASSVPPRILRRNRDRIGRPGYPRAETGVPRARGAPVNVIADVVRVRPAGVRALPRGRPEESEVVAHVAVHERPAVDRGERGVQRGDRGGAQHGRDVAAGAGPAHVVIRGGGDAKGRGGRDGPGPTDARARHGRTRLGHPARRVQDLHVGAAKHANRNVRPVMRVVARLEAESQAQSAPAKHVRVDDSVPGLLARRSLRAKSLQERGAARQGRRRSHEHVGMVHVEAELAWSLGV